MIIRARRPGSGPGGGWVWGWVPCSRSVVSLDPLHSDTGSRHDADPALSGNRPGDRRGGRDFPLRHGRGGSGGARRRDRGVRGMEAAPGHRARRGGEADRRAVHRARRRPGRADHQGDGQAACAGRWRGPVLHRHLQLLRRQRPGLIADKPLPGHDTARVEYRPVGPVLGVMPWNYPYYQVARFAAPNLIVGNTVILKHAENCPTSALAIAQIMKDAGVPDGVYVNLFATHEQVAAMIADPRLHGVSLTGSERAGTVVAETAGRNLKKVVLELGGSDPYIVLDTDDVE